MQVTLLVVTHEWLKLIDYPGFSWFVLCPIPNNVLQLNARWIHDSPNILVFVLQKTNCCRVLRNSFLLVKILSALPFHICTVIFYYFMKTNMVDYWITLREFCIRVRHKINVYISSMPQMCNVYIHYVNYIDHKRSPKIWELLYWFE